MTLIIAAYVPTGIVLSGDSRTTFRNTQTAFQQPTPPAAPTPQPMPPGAMGVPVVLTNVHTNLVLSDSTEKVFILHERFGVATMGDAHVNNMPIAHHVQQFGTQVPGPAATTQQVAQDLLTFFRSLQPIPDVHFFVAGYDGSAPFVYNVEVRNNAVTRKNADAQGNAEYGLLRGGERDVANRLLSQPQFIPPFNLMNLQDAVDFSRHLIRSTIDQLRFEPRPSTVGGPIDTLIVTPAGARFLRRKEICCA